MYVNIKTSYILSGIALMAPFLISRNPRIIQLDYENTIDTSIQRILLFLNSRPPELKQFYSSPKLVINQDAPINVILIIGESFWSKHSSLYSYKKNNNPKLTNLKQDHFLYTFKNVTSSKTNTQEVFKTLMSTYNPDQNEIKWYHCRTLPEIISLRDYHLSWISNQAPNGTWDNVLSRYADLCNNQYYTKGKYDLDKVLYDESIIPIVKSIKPGSLNFYIINLMGSHFKFSSRFPTSFAKFNATDYMEHPEHQRQTIADYDNSILYNDYVVSEIINLFKDKEAIVVYLSDHSIDLFQSDPNYAAHAKPGNAISEKVSKEIPFMIYMSRAYQEKYPEMVEAVKRNLDSPFRTDNLIYTMMDIMGCDFADKPMRSRSLLRQK